MSWKLVIVGDADHEDKYSQGLKELAKKTPGGYEGFRMIAEKYDWDDIAEKTMEVYSKVTRDDRMREEG